MPIILFILFFLDMKSPKNNQILRTNLSKKILNIAKFFLSDFQSARTKQALFFYSIVKKSLSLLIKMNCTKNCLIQKVRLLSEYPKTGCKAKYTNYCLRRLFKAAITITMFFMQNSFLIRFCKYFSSRNILIPTHTRSGSKICSANRK